MRGKCFFSAHAQCILSHKTRLLSLSMRADYTFKWSAHIFCIKRHNPHFPMEKHRCPSCTHPFPMDPICVTALCGKAVHLEENFIQAWPASFHAYLSEWWHMAALARHRSNCMRTLTPIPLCNHFFSRMGLTTKNMQKPPRWALKDRRQKTTTAVKKSQGLAVRHPSELSTPPSRQLEPVKHEKITYGHFIINIAHAQATVP